MFESMVLANPFVRQCRKYYACCDGYFQMVLHFSDWLNTILQSGVSTALCLWACEQTPTHIPVWLYYTQRSQHVDPWESASHQCTRRDTQTHAAAMWFPPRPPTSSRLWPTRLPPPAPPRDAQRRWALTSPAVGREPAAGAEAGGDAIGV